MGKKPTKFDEGIVVKTSTTAPSAEGEIRNKDSKLQTYIDGAERDIVTDDQTQTLENKTIDGTSATGNNTVTTDADQVTYNNATSGLSATDSQGAIDEVEGRLDTAESNITTNASNLSNHLVDAVDAHDASAISNVPSGNLASTDVQSALNELQSDIDTRALDSDLTAHINDTTDAHDASAISNVPSGNLAATDVQTALNELQTDIDSRALDTDLTAHLNDTVDAHDGSAISFDNVASGLTATTVQGAIDEVEGRVDTNETDISTNATNLSNHLADTVDAHDASAISYDNTTSGLTATETQSAIDEVEARLDTAESNITTNASDLSDHEALTSGVHGVTGTVVGTTDTQTLTNKTITGASIQTPSRLDVKKDTLANLETYAGSATDGELVYATDTDQYFGITDATLVPIGGGGAGSLSTFYSEDFEDFQDVSSFSTGNNATFLGAGSIVGTLALETLVQIAGDTSVKFTQASGSLNDYVASEVITIENKEQGNWCGISAYYEYDGANSDIEFVVYDVTNANVLIRETLNATTKATKLEFNNILIPANCTSIRWGFQVAVENIGAIFIIDDVELNVDPRSIGQWVEVNSVELSGSGGELITAGTENIVFNGSGTGWDGSNYEYEVQKSGSIIELSGSVFWDTNSGAIISVYVNGTFYRSVSNNITTTRMKPIGIEIPNLSQGDIISLRSSLAITLETSGDYHWLNIIETVNRRSIMSEVDNGSKSYTPSSIQGFGTPTGVEFNYTHVMGTDLVHVWGRAVTGTVTADEVQIPLPNGWTIKDVSGSNVKSVGVFERHAAGSNNGYVILATQGDSYFNVGVFSSGTNPITPVGGTTAMASTQGFSFFATVSVNEISANQQVAITLHRTVADGNEYPVFGEEIQLADGTRYQIFERAYIGPISATIDTGLTPLGGWGIVAGIWYKLLMAGANSAEYTRLSYNPSTGAIASQVASQSITGVPISFRYYDTARPLN